jgi:hypothetical protein
VRVVRKIKETFQTFIYFIIYIPIVKGGTSHSLSLRVTTTLRIFSHLHIYKETSTEIRLKFTNTHLMLINANLELLVWAQREIGLLKGNKHIQSLSIDYWRGLWQCVHEQRCHRYLVEY